MVYTNQTGPDGEDNPVEEWEAQCDRCGDVWKADDLEEYENARSHYEQCCPSCVSFLISMEEEAGEILE